MASIINSTDTGSGGLITTGDSSDELQLQTAETTAVTITSGQQSAFIAGTAAAPAVTTTGDLNTGIFFSAANTVDIATDGVARAQVNSVGDFAINAGFGSVGKAYLCRAWVNFNGQTNVGGNCTIRASGNVSTVTDNGTGNYTVNFTTAMPDVNYGTAGSVGRSFASTDGIGRDICVDRYATGSVGIRCGDSDSFAAEDAPVICLSIFR